MTTCCLCCTSARRSLLFCHSVAPAFHFAAVLIRGLFKKSVQQMLFGLLCVWACCNKLCSASDDGKSRLMTCLVDKILHRQQGEAFWVSIPWCCHMISCRLFVLFATWVNPCMWCLLEMFKKTQKTSYFGDITMIPNEEEFKDLISLARLLSLVESTYQMWRQFMQCHSRLVSFLTAKIPHTNRM